MHGALTGRGVSYHPCDRHLEGEKGSGGNRWHDSSMPVANPYGQGVKGRALGSGWPQVDSAVGCYGRPCGRLPGSQCRACRRGIPQCHRPAVHGERLNHRVWDKL